ncbi:hypothetical protein SAMN06269117_12919 [Balnearium lithotrophicum]|uniref:Uncharacterized protein n=1 Tax=Balnearium lithotrophicum TaxID=223788 RepID=A0A521E1Q5_9BACT|nr:winged helix-turn-helix domain-containing protein [Balnearium lithotrophicum]SMO77241.1 hypothetical protein SAMN06269117_12919 [Balnearium lithotrophicum]
MKSSEIFILMDRLKVFQLNELVDKLIEDWGFLGKSYIKTRVQSEVYGWVRYGIVVKVNDDPPVFALKEYADNWREYYSGVKTCPVCGKKFLSRRGKQDRYCSARCRERARARRRKTQVRKNVRRYYRGADSTAENYRKPWTEKEIEFLKENYGKLTQKEIAKRLGRTVPAVKAKVKELSLKAR